MKYKKLHLDFKYVGPNRFYRDLLVSENINLVDLGCAIVSAFGGAFEHNFLFKANGLSYNPRCFIVGFAMDNDVLMDDYNLNDLGNKFEFNYDTGDGWDFVCTVSDTSINVGMNDVVLIDGRGQGIWEDNIYSDGKIDPERREVDEEKGYYLPWNFMNEKFGDFDEAFDLENKKQEFSLSYMMDRESYKMGEAEYFGFEYKSEEEKIHDINMLSIYDELMFDVKMQIKRLDFVGEIYQELLKTYKPKEAKEMIAKEFLFEEFHSIKEKRDFSYKKYHNALKKLIK